MTDESKKGNGCEHDWRVVDTRTNPMHGTDRNPVFTLECRRCKARETAEGHEQMKDLSKNQRLTSGLG